MTTTATTNLDQHLVTCFRCRTLQHCAAGERLREASDAASNPAASLPLVTPITVTQIQSEYHEFKAADGRIIMLTDILPEHAALIVQAVNSFDALRDALRNIAGVGHARQDATRANDKLDQVMEWAEAALAIAEGKDAQ